MANHRGGSGNFAEDRERASEAGKKVDSTAGVISRMTRSAHLKQVKRWQEQSRQKRQLAGLISDECIFVCSSSKAITAGYPVVDTDDNVSLPDARCLSGLPEDCNILNLHCFVGRIRRYAASGIKTRTLSTI